MNTLTAPVRVASFAPPATRNNILPFVDPVQRPPVQAARLKLAQHGLLELSVQRDLAGLGAGAGAVLLAGENVLLPAGDEGRCRYGCCMYVVSQDGGKAVPVVGCRSWFQAPLPAPANAHAVWAEISGGLVEAVSRLQESMFDLNGAVVAARSWISFRHAEIPAREGSVLLLGRDSHLLCAALPEPTPPQKAAVMAAATSRIVLKMPVPLPHGLRLAA